MVQMAVFTKTFFEQLAQRQILLAHCIVYQVAFTSRRKNLVASGLGLVSFLEDWDGIWLPKIDTLLASGQLSPRANYRRASFSGAIFQEI